MIIIKEVNFGCYKNEILKLRKDIWERENLHRVQKVSAMDFCDEHDGYACHWVAFDGNHIIASARLSNHLSLPGLSAREWNEEADAVNINFPIAFFSWLVIQKSYRKEGLGERFDKQRMARAKELKCNSVCIITYGHATKRIMDYGFEALHSSMLTNVFKTEMQSIGLFPLAFYYKGIAAAEMA